VAPSFDQFPTVESAAETHRWDVVCMEPANSAYSKCRVSMVKCEVCKTWFADRN